MSEMSKIIRKGMKNGRYDRSNWIGSAEKWADTINRWGINTEERISNSPCYRVFVYRSNGFVYATYMNGYGDELEIGWTHEVIDRAAEKRFYIASQEASEWFKFN